MREIDFNVFFSLFCWEVFIVKYDGEGNIIVALLDDSRVISKETIKQENYKQYKKKLKDVKFSEPEIIFESKDKEYVVWNDGLKI